MLLFCDEEWPDGEIRSEPGWDRLSDVAMPLIDDIINTHYAPGGHPPSCHGGQIESRGAYQTAS